MNPPFSWLKNMWPPTVSTSPPLLLNYDLVLDQLISIAKLWPRSVNVLDCIKAMPFQTGNFCMRFKFKFSSWICDWVYFTHTKASDIQMNASQENYFFLTVNFLLIFYSFMYQEQKISQKILAWTGQPALGYQSCTARETKIKVNNLVIINRLLKYY